MRFRPRCLILPERRNKPLTLRIRGSLLAPACLLPGQVVYDLTDLRFDQQLSEKHLATNGNLGVTFRADYFREASDGGDAALDPAFTGSLRCVSDLNSPFVVRCLVSDPRAPGAEDVVLESVAATLESLLHQHRVQLTDVARRLIRWLLSRDAGVLIYFLTFQSQEVPAPEGDFIVLNAAETVNKKVFVCPTFEGDLLRIKVPKIFSRQELSLTANAQLNTCLQIAAPAHAPSPPATRAWRPLGRAMRMYLLKNSLAAAPITSEAQPSDSECCVQLPVSKTNRSGFYNYCYSAPVIRGWSGIRVIECRTCRREVSVPPRRTMWPQIIRKELQKMWTKESDAALIEESVIDLVHEKLTSRKVLMKVFESVAECVKEHPAREELLERLLDVYVAHDLLKSTSILLGVCVIFDRLVSSTHVCELLVAEFSSLFNTWQARRRILYFLVQYLVGEAGDAGSRQPRKPQRVLWQWLQSCLIEAAYEFHCEACSSKSEHLRTCRDSDSDCCVGDAAVEFILDALWMLISESELVGIEALKTLEEVEVGLLECPKCLSLLRCFYAQTRFRSLLRALSDKVKRQTQRMDTADHKTTRLRDLMHQSSFADLISLESSERASPEAAEATNSILDHWFSQCALIQSPSYVPLNIDFPLPLRPREIFKALNSERTVIVRSSKYPMLVDCVTTRSCVAFLSTCSHTPQPAPTPGLGQVEEAPRANTAEEQDPETVFQDPSCREVPRDALAAEIEPANLGPRESLQNRESDNWTLNLEGSCAHSPTSSVRSSRNADEEWEVLNFKPPSPTAKAPPAVSVKKEGYRFLHKVDDDVRQDCLMTETFRFLEAEIFSHVLNIPTHLSPYKVLPLAGREGLIEFVDSAMAFSTLGKTNPSLSEIIRTKEQKIRFLESLAGYCLVTYVFDVGDRHLDNLMVLPDGRMFHVDFGYIFGSDPKPFAKVPMRLTGEMTSALGSNLFVSFVIRTITLYFAMRRQNHELMAMLQLLGKSTIPDLKKEEQCHQFVGKYLLQSKDDLLCIENLINDVIIKSLSALAPTIADYLHNWVIYFK